MFNTHSNNQWITGYILHSVAWLWLFLILPPPNGSWYEWFITMILSPIFFFIPIILSIIIRIKSKKIYTYWDYGIVMIFIFLWLFMLSPFEWICGIYTVCDTVGRDIIYLTMALSPLVFAFKKNLSKIIFMIGIALLYGVFSFIYFIYLPKELGIMRQYLISKSPEFHKVYADYYDRIGKRFNTPTRIIEDIKLNIPNVANHFSIDNQVEHVLYFLPWITDKLTSSTESYILTSNATL